MMESRTHDRVDVDAVRAALVAEREKLLAELTMLDTAEAELSESQRAEGGVTGDTADVASDLVEQAVDEAVERTARQHLADVDLALDRLEAGRYGRCEECGAAIDPARLHALPWARRCMDCQRRMERGTRRY